MSWTNIYTLLKVSVIDSQTNAVIGNAQVKLMSTYTSRTADMTPQQLINPNSTGNQFYVFKVVAGQVDGSQSVGLQTMPSVAIVSAPGYVTQQAAFTIVDTQLSNLSSSSISQIPGVVTTPGPFTVKLVSNSNSLTMSSTVIGTITSGPAGNTGYTPPPAPMFNFLRANITVVDKQTNLPIPQAVVKVLYGNVPTTLTCDDNGNCLFSTVPSGNVTGALVTANEPLSHSINYSAATAIVQLSAGGTSYQLALAPIDQVGPTPQSTVTATLTGWHTIGSYTPPIAPNLQPVTPITQDLPVTASTTGSGWTWLILILVVLAVLYYLYKRKEEAAT